MDRRGFLQAILASGIAPVIIPYANLMKPSGILVPWSISEHYAVVWTDSSLFTDAAQLAIQYASRYGKVVVRGGIAYMMERNGVLTEAGSTIRRVPKLNLVDRFSSAYVLSNSHE